jgi:hypothetical protein
LAGPVSDQDPELGDAIAKIHHQVAGLLGWSGHLPPVRITPATHGG